MTPEQYIPLLVILVMLPVIVMRNRRARTLRPRWMWVVPLLMIVLMGFAIWGTSFQPGLDQAPFDALAWVVLIVGGLLGVVAGWWRGRMTTIEKHPDGTLRAQASPVGLILIVALLFGRRALGAWLEPHAASLGLNPLAVADAFLVFVAAMIVVQRLEMFIRARRVMAGHTDAHVQATA